LGPVDSCALGQLAATLEAGEIFGKWVSPDCWCNGQSCRSTIKLTMFEGDLEDLASVAHKPSRLGTRESDRPVAADIR